MFSQEQLSDMLNAQHQCNIAASGANYMEQNLPFHRAAAVEAAEFAGHLGYKWWKKFNPDFPQAQLELIDIWHFLMSCWLKEYPDYSINQVANIMSSFDTRAELCQPTAESINSILIINDSFIGRVSLTDLNQSTYLLFTLFHKMGLSATEVYFQYACKNALNLLRYQNGYLSGTYKKNEWPVPGKEGVHEDNEYLTWLMDHYREQPNLIEPIIENGGLITFMMNKLNEHYQGQVIGAKAELE